MEALTRIHSVFLLDKWQLTGHQKDGRRENMDGSFLYEKKSIRVKTIKRQPCGYKWYFECVVL